MTEFFSLQTLLALVLGAVYGVLFGAIPGLSATLAVALFVPIAFYLESTVAISAIIAISAVAIFAGDISSVVARIPGTPASAAYIEELIRVTRQRGPLRALGLCALASAVGGAIGTLLLAFGATGLATIARQFASEEFFWVAVLGLTAGIFAAKGPPVKALLALLLGMLFATVGIDPTLGYPRFHFDNPNLLSGLNYVVALIGLFGFAEVLEHFYRSHQGVPPESEARPRTSSLRDYFAEPLAFIVKARWVSLRSSLVGTCVGFLPGAGADIAAWVSSSLQKMTQQRSAEGDDEKVIVAAASSNNAGVAGAWVPALSLGIPGDSITAIVLGIFLMQGITPGPALFQNQMELVWSMYLAFFLSSVVLLPLLGFAMANVVVFIARVPVNLLMGAIAALCVLGAYAINNNFFDIYIMLAMGLLGFVLRRGGFPMAQVVLGMVLGVIVENNFMVSMIKARGELLGLVDRPVALTFALLTLVVIVAGVGLRSRRTP